MAFGRVALELDSGGISRPIATIGDLQAFFETRDFALGGVSRDGRTTENDKQVKFWSGMILEVDDASILAGMTVQVGLKNRLTDPVKWFTPVTLQHGNEPVWFPREIHGSRYIRFKIFDSSVVGIWRITALEVFGSLDGGRM